MRIEHIDRFVIGDRAAKAERHAVEAMKDHVTRLGLHPGFIEDASKGNAAPLGDAAPALDTVVSSDLGARRHVSQLCKRQVKRSLDQAGNAKLVSGKAVLLQREIGRITRVGGAVRSLPLPDLALGKFRRQPISRHQQPLCSVSKAVGGCEKVAHATATANEAVECVAPGKRQRRGRRPCRRQEAPATEEERAHVLPPRSTERLMR